MKIFVSIILALLGFFPAFKLNLFDSYVYKMEYDFPSEKKALSPMNPFLNASSVIVGEVATGKIIIAKNENEIRSIASVTKLVTALTIINGQQEMDELLTVTEEDWDTIKGSSSHIPHGATFSRSELLNLALMSSENRASLCLARNYYGGSYYFVRDMNRLCLVIGASNSYFVDPSGLSPRNVSTASDLFKIARASYCKEMIRDFSTRDDLFFESKGSKFRRYFGNTNDIVVNEKWLVKMSKTGYILEAGRCLVLVFEARGKDYAMVLLGEKSVAQRDNDAETIRKWVEEVVN